MPELMKLSSGGSRSERKSISEMFGKQIVEATADIDLSSYESAECPVCDGKGSRLGRPCSFCEGEGKVEQNFLEGEIDWSLFDLVECPVCEGKKYRHGRACSACGGEGKLEQRDLENLQ